MTLGGQSHGRCERQEEEKINKIRIDADISAIRERIHCKPRYEKTGEI